MSGSLVTAWLLASAALAAGEPDATGEPEEPAEEAKEGTRWSGLVLPIVGYNSTDGFGAGLGGEVYARPRSAEYGYKVKFTGSLYATLGFRYTSNWLRVDSRGDTDWLGLAGYRAWQDLLFAGAGGADVLVDWGDLEGGNALRGPFAFLGASRPLRTGDRSAPSAYLQAYFRNVVIEARPGSLLEQRQPFGFQGGTYADLTAGVEIDRTDRWPLPIDGWRGEVDVRGGATFSGGEVAPLIGLHSEVVAWKPVFGERLVVGGRVLLARSFGRRPFFEQDVTGGRWRDELGSEQALAGYGRTRTRGDGVAAAMVEVRPLLFRTHHDFFDIALFLSLFAEEALLFEGLRVGPHLPTVGFGPELLWQGAIQLRPFLAWGWRADTPGGERQPSMQVGVSFLDPL